MPHGDSFAFFGRIHPERASVRIDNVFELNHHGKYGVVEIEAFIHGSHVLVDAIPTEEVDNLATLRNIVQGAVAALTDQLAFLLGNHVNVEMFAVITPDGYKQVFGIEYDYIREKVSTKEAFETLQPKIFNIYRTEAGQYLQRCLTDFRLAMEHPGDTGFYCYRAVESLRQVFAEDGDNGESWEALREVTGTSEYTIKNDIKAYADARRHGDIFSITAEERQLVLETTWDIIQKFIEFGDENFEELAFVEHDE